MAKSVFSNKQKKDIVFCLILLALPLIQFSVFYIGVNINSFVMVFQRYEVNAETGIGSYVFNGFKNFDTMIKQIYYDGIFLGALKNSLLAFVLVTLVGVTLALVFSLYIYKRMPLSSTFRVLLFAPSILSAVVTVTMFRYFVEDVIPVLFHLEQGLLANQDTKFGTILFFNVWIGFGTQVLMYSGAMSGIDPSITEAARLDGAGPAREFFSIILPLIFPTLQTFLVAGVAGLFINQVNLLEFSGLWSEAKYMTVGYYLFKNAQSASSGELPLLATYGVSLTLIAAPLTLLTRKLLDKYGPSVE